MPTTLKDRFLDAIIAGELGQQDEYGIIIRLRDFKGYFTDIHSDYVNSFLPAATIEPGRHASTHTKYLFRVRKGIYRVHPDVLAAHKKQHRSPTHQSIERIQVVQWPS